MIAMKRWNSKHLQKWVVTASLFTFQFFLSSEAISRNRNAQTLPLVYDEQPYEIIQTGRWSVNTSPFISVGFSTNQAFATGTPIIFQVANGLNPLPGASYDFATGTVAFYTPGVYQVIVGIQATTGGTVALRQFSANGSITTVQQFNCAVGTLTTTTNNITVSSNGGNGIQGAIQVINTGAAITCEPGTYIQVTRLSS